MGNHELSRGTNLSGVRLYNERLILSLIRRHGAIPKAEIARLTSLSAQTVSVIMRQLDADSLVQAQSRIKGKIGQPSVPFSLKREGAYGIGIKVGRRTIELVVLDFLGTVLLSVEEAYAYPTANAVVRFIKDTLATLETRLGGEILARVAGVGIANPFQLWNWTEELNAPDGAMDDWRDFDLLAEIETFCRWPVYIGNDATAACAAELTFGIGSDHDDHIYFFIGFFAGGGLVLNGNPVAGKRGNAGALGSMPVPDGAGEQLNQCASVYLLEQMMSEAGDDPLQLRESEKIWTELGETFDAWLNETARCVAFAAITASAVLDLDAVIIDGAFPGNVRNRLVDQVGKKIAKIDRRGLTGFDLVEGTIGSSARAIGGACLPLMANFARNQDVLFKT